MTGCTPFETREVLGEELIGFDDGWLVLHNAISGVFSKISVFGIKEAIPLPIMPGDGTNLVVDRESNWWISSKYSGIFSFPGNPLKRGQFLRVRMPWQLPRLPKWGGSGRMACI